MKVEVSNGELLDKVSILKIKLERITDKEKLVNIKKEYDTLKPHVDKLMENTKTNLHNYFSNLSDLNNILWDIEDWIRDCEKRQDFGPEFIQLARSVYTTNDRRSEIKKIINQNTNSILTEEKSYHGKRINRK